MAFLTAPERFPRSYVISVSSLVVCLGFANIVVTSFTTTPPSTTRVSVGFRFALAIELASECSRQLEMDSVGERFLRSGRLDGLSKLFMDTVRYGFRRDAFDQLLMCPLGDGRSLAVLQ